MKKSELRQLIAKYNELQSKKIQNKKLIDKLKEIEHRYYHETGKALKSDFKIR